MADNSFDCAAASNLLCTEAESLCFDDDLETESDVIGEKISEINDKDLSLRNGRSGISMLFPCLSEEKFCLMIDKERDHLPKDDYLKRLRAGDIDMSVRREALDWILKAHAHYGFGEVAFCLAMHYFDQFLSLYELPRGKSWTVQLLAVACLSLAAKMEEINVPLAVDLQVGEPKFVFESKTIQRMELLVLSSLEWKMRAYTPYTFIDYFLKKIIGDHDQRVFETLIEKAIKLIISATKGIDFLEFRPSEIAAAVAIFVASSETTHYTTNVDKTMSCFISTVEKGKVVKCLELIQDSTVMSMGSTNAAATTTTNIGSGSVVGSCCPNSSQVNSNSSPDSKRKKLIDNSSKTNIFQKS